MEMVLLQKVKFDKYYTIILGIIICVGITMIFSASSIRALEQFGDMYYFFNKQIINVVIGVVIMIIAAKIKYQKYREFLIWINGITIFLQCLVIFSSFGQSVNGAERWLNIAGFQFQPSEIAKITVVLTLAHIIHVKKQDGTMNSIRQGILPTLAYIGLYVGLILAQKHLSGAGLILLVAVTMLLIGGVKIFYFIVMAASTVAVAIIGVIIEPFRVKRILGFLDPEANALGDGYQIVQSWYALGSGEIFGLGIGMSRQKFNWLPENHTDYIMAIIGEELGFIGVFFIVLLFTGLVVRGFTIASKANELFGSMIVVGITLIFLFQATINFAVVTGWFPTTGMPLPFISYGGTSTVILFIGVGLIYNVYSQIPEKKDE